MLFFALSAATIDLGTLVRAGLPAVALILARSLCKFLAVAAVAPMTGIGWRKGMHTALGLLPMSTIALMLTHQVSQLNPQIGAQADTVLLASVIVLQVVGTLTLLYAVRASGEARAAP
jgi:Kef-type K+ transport system membrane component KefB